MAKFGVSHTMKWVCALLLLCNTIVCNASSRDHEWFQYDAHQQVQVNVELFLSSTCALCHKVDDLFREIEKKHPWVVVHRYLTNQDKSALRRFDKRLQQVYVSRLSVPAIFFCDSYWKGFNAIDDTGFELMRALNECHRAIARQGTLSDALVSTLRQEGLANHYETLIKNTPTGIAFVFLAALVNTISMCNLFCLISFVCFLWLVPQQSWRRFGVGMVFIGTIGALHYAQQTQAHLYYQVPAHFFWVGFCTGILLLTFVLRDAWKRPRFEGIKPVSQVLCVGLLTLISVYVYQESCSMNVGCVFEDWIAAEPSSWVVRWIYPWLYQVSYVFPLFVLLCVLCSLGRFRLWARHQQVCRIFARLMLLCVGVILVVRPTLFTDVWIFYLMCFGLLPLAWIIRR